MRCAALTLLLVCSVPLHAAGEPNDDKEVEEVEEVEEVGAVTPVAAPQAPRGTLQLIGKLHPLFVHFPIAWLLLLALVDGVTFLFRREGWARAGLWLLGLTVLVAVPAVITGLLRAAHINDPKMLEEIAEHRNLALIALALTTAALLVRLVRRDALTGLWRLLYLVLIAASVGLVAATGHHGGVLVFGHNYLTF